MLLRSEIIISSEFKTVQDLRGNYGKAEHILIILIRFKRLL